MSQFIRIMEKLCLEKLPLTTNISVTNHFDRPVNETFLILIYSKSPECKSGLYHPCVGYAL